MSSKWKINEAVETLSKIKMDPQKSKELWHALERRIDSTHSPGCDRPTRQTLGWRRPAWGQLGAGIAASLLISSGIVYGVYHDPLLKNSGTAVGRKGLPTTVLKLPDGQIVTPEHPARWKDLSLSIRVEPLSPVYVGEAEYDVIVGNKSTIVSHQRISTSVGPATLVYAIRATMPTDEYYVIVDGIQHSYIIQAEVVGDSALAKRELIQVVSGWKIPVSFNDKWNASAHSRYKVGITNQTTPLMPENYESSVFPLQGIARIVSSLGKGTVKYGTSWTKATTFYSSPFVINGVSYSVPEGDKNSKFFVLPIDTGIVWAQVGMVNQPTLKGYTNIYFTPYHSSDVSLTEGAALIGRLPHKWLGLDGPVVGSAWAGWLPKEQIVMPQIPREDFHQLTFTAKNTVQSDAVQTSPFSSNWPSLFMKAVPENPSGKPDYSAHVGSLIRTQGGFILQVGFIDITHTGRNSGMAAQGAYYYWSENSRKWTPLTQIYGAQTMAGSFSAGSKLVYWEEVVPNQNSDFHTVDVAQMYYNPLTNLIKSIWLGDIYYASFVDGRSIGTVLVKNIKPAGTQPTWTIYTP